MSTGRVQRASKTHLTTLIFANKANVGADLEKDISGRNSALRNRGAEVAPSVQRRRRENREAEGVSIWRALSTPPRIFFSRTAPALTMLVKRNVVKCFLPTRPEWGGVWAAKFTQKQLAVTQSHSKRYR